MMANANAVVEEIYRSDWGRIVATLIRQFGDFDLAEEAAQEAFAAALADWPSSGIPDSPSAWVVQAARNKAIDRIRRRARFEEKRIIRESRAEGLENVDMASSPGVTQTSSLRRKTHVHQPTVSRLRHRRLPLR